MSTFDSENEVRLIGRLGKDPELKYTPGGAAVCNFTVATSRSFKVGDEWKEKVAWHTVTAWNTTAEACAQYLKKGQRVRIAGFLEYGSCEKDGVKIPTCKITAEKVMFLDRPNGTGEHTQPQTGHVISADDIPF